MVYNCLYFTWLLRFLWMFLFLHLMVTFYKFFFVYCHFWTILSGTLFKKYWRCQSLKNQNNSSSSHIFGTVYGIWCTNILYVHNIYKQHDISCKHFYIKVIRPTVKSVFAQKLQATANKNPFRLPLLTPGYPTKNAAKLLLSSKVAAIW